LNVLAITELKLGKPESAEAHLEQALKKSPNNLKSSVALARTRLARKDVAGAEEALKQAAAQAPKSPERGFTWRVLSGFGQNARGGTGIPARARDRSKKRPALLNLGAVQVRAGHPEQAEQTYRLVAALPQKQYKPIHALYLFQSGKNAQAVSEFESWPKTIRLTAICARTW